MKPCQSSLRPLHSISNDSIPSPAREGPTPSTHKSKLLLVNNSGNILKIIELQPVLIRNLTTSNVNTVGTGYAHQYWQLAANVLKTIPVTGINNNINRNLLPLQLTDGKNEHNVSIITQNGSLDVAKNESTSLPTNELLCGEIENYNETSDSITPTPSFINLADHSEYSHARIKTDDPLRSSNETENNDLKVITLKNEYFYKAYNYAEAIELQRNSCDRHLVEKSPFCMTEDLPQSTNNMLDDLEEVTKSEETQEFDETLNSITPTPSFINTGEHSQFSYASTKADEFLNFSNEIEDNTLKDITSKNQHVHDSFNYVEAIEHQKNWCYRNHIEKPPFCMREYLSESTNNTLDDLEEIIKSEEAQEINSYDADYLSAEDLIKYCPVTQIFDPKTDFNNAMWPSNVNTDSIEDLIDIYLR